VNSMHNDSVLKHGKMTKIMIFRACCNIKLKIDPVLN
jgi:hypothetical protein